MTITDLPGTDTPPTVSKRSAAPQRPPIRSWKLARHKVLSYLVTVILAVAAWALFAPPQLGGNLSYVITDGISMLPHFHAGDLVFLRSEPSYHVGEIAAYHNGQLHEVVMHRIVAEDGGHFVFKGDNNNFRDSFQPTASGIVGVEWIHLPGMGKYVEQVRRPVVAAVFLGLIWVFSFGPSKQAGRNRKRRHRRA